MLRLHASKQRADGQMRMPALDLLRGLSAAAVEVSPCLLYADPVPVASKAVSIMSVEVFFALSGIVLAPLIMRITRNVAEPRDGVHGRALCRVQRGDYLPGHQHTVGFGDTLLQEASLPGGARYLLGAQHPLRQRKPLQLIQRRV